VSVQLTVVDAFTDRPFAGNPAAVAVVDRFPAEAHMQEIASEMNLSETAFAVARGDRCHDLRWFTPTLEVDLCGHATLASAWVLYRLLGESAPQLRFATRSGELVVTRGPDGLTMSLPSAPSQPFDAPAGFREALSRSLSAAPGELPSELHVSDKGGAGARALIALWNSPDAVKALVPGADLAQVLMQAHCGSLLATAAGGGKPYDMVSRFFAPYFGVPEDPVTGSAHCALTPFWAKRLGKTVLKARQASHRGGDLLCTDAGTRTLITGDCALYLTGEIEV
jgi:PhzF family phenazine biosynthesis protein